VGRVDQLVTELTQLSQRLGLDEPARRHSLRQAGPPEAPADVETAGYFDLVVLIELS